MPGVASILEKGLNSILKNGQVNQINLVSFAINSGSYDDETVGSVTGSNIVSGLFFPITSNQGSTEAMLLEQGKILTKDKVLYTGSVNTNGNILIEVGSKTGDWYTIIPDGIQTWEINGSVILNKMFLRHTIPGSLF